MSIAAAVDMGSNSFRLLVAEVAGNTWRPLRKELVTVRLGQGLAASGLLREEAMARGCAALAAFARQMAPHVPAFLRVCGTQALRRAANSEQFTERASSLLGCRVEVLSGEEEARLTLAGVSAGLGSRLAHPLLLADVGGGSTELLVQEEPGGSSRQVSLPMGAVSLSESFADTRAMAGQIRALLAGACASFLPAGCTGPPPFRLVASGGSATSLAALDLGLERYDEDLVHGHSLKRARLSGLCRALRAMTQAQRAALPALAQGRSEIIVAGAMIYEELLALAGLDRVTVSDAGLLEGILLSGIHAGEYVQ